jgi:hypothetical protein
MFSKVWDENNILACIYYNDNVKKHTTLKNDDVEKCWLSKSFILYLTDKISI